MKKYEQKFCTDLKKWLTYNMKETCFIEAKISTENKPFNFNSGFKPHQLPTLAMIDRGPFGYKISDMDRMQKPFDLIFSYKAKTYIAIHWIRKGNKRFYLITPTAIQGLIDDSYKSIDEKMASIISNVTGELK